MYMNFYSVFLQMSVAVKGLQQIYMRDEVEARSMFKIALDAMNAYNMKVGTMKRTKQIIKDNMGHEEYKRWAEQYIKRKPMEMKVTSVSIVIFLLNFFSFFELKVHRTLPNIF